MPQRINTEFGKNRVQYHDDFKYWYEYESENFVTYWYGKSRNVGQSAVMYAEYDHDEIVNILEYSLRDKIEIVVYLDVSDLHQSNLGLDNELFANNGETYVIGNKMFVYFDGDHLAMRRQIRKGIASVYFNSILFGSSLQDMVQNAISLDLPEWYKDGLIDFVGQPWDFQKENHLKELFGSGLDINFHQLSIDHPELAGHSFWYFIARKYGNTAISNIIYLTRIRKDLNSGFEFVLNKEINELLTEWKEFYKSDLDNGQGFDPIESPWQSFDKKKNTELQAVSLSDDGKSIAYVTNEQGKTKIFLRSTDNPEAQLLWKKGQRAAMIETDRNYPVIDFHPNGKELIIIYEFRNDIYYRSINLASGEFKEDIFPGIIERVYHIDYSDKSRFLLSVSIDGYAELISFSPNNRQYKRLSSDYHDDLEPQAGVLNDEKGVFLASNRPGYLRQKEAMKSIVPLNHSDIYFLTTDGSELYQITNSPLIHESKPMVKGSSLYYLSDKIGTLPDISPRSRSIGV